MSFSFKRIRDYRYLSKSFISWQCSFRKIN
ncbi:hypothetical protein vBEcoMWL3_gp145c [Escherichia phage vB_EcoM_WL-3]|nr:hypothetical protein vBEcoMWL3_gp145c [Escherichia phage vB_EcoM_WL-3]